MDRVGLLIIVMIACIAIFDNPIPRFERLKDRPTCVVIDREIYCKEGK